MSISSQNTMSKPVNTGAYLNVELPQITFSGVIDEGRVVELNSTSTEGYECFVYVYEATENDMTIVSRYKTTPEHLTKDKYVNIPLKSCSSFPKFSDEPSGDFQGSKRLKFAIEMTDGFVTSVVGFQNHGKLYQFDFYDANDIESDRIKAACAEFEVGGDNFNTPLF